MSRSRPLIIVLALAAIALTGCAPTTPSGPDVHESSTPTTASTPATDIPEFDSACKDSAGDGSSAVDIRSARIYTLQGLVFFEVRLDAATSAGDVDDLFAQFYIYGPDGNGGYLSGSHWVGSAATSEFVFDNAPPMNHELDNGPIFADGLVTWRAPMALLPELASTFIWYVTVDQDGEPTDACGSVDAPVTVDQA